MPNRRQTYSHPKVPIPSRRGSNTSPRRSTTNGVSSSRGYSLLESQTTRENVLDVIEDVLELLERCPITTFDEGRTERTGA
jgi:hypothetical protein